MSLRWLFLVLAVAGAQVVGAAGHAAGPAITTKALAEHAARIVHATHVAAASRWEPQARLIVTEHRFRVHATLKGRPVDEITVLVPGGQLPEHNLQLTVPHQAVFAADEEVVLFVGRDQLGNAAVLGGEHGKLRVARDAHGARVVGRRSLGDVTAQITAAVRQETRR